VGLTLAHTLWLFYNSAVAYLKWAHIYIYIYIIFLMCFFELKCGFLFIYFYHLLFLAFFNVMPMNLFNWPCILFSQFYSIMLSFY
jgi:hypothetical protein